MAASTQPIQPLPSNVHSQITSTTEYHSIIDVIEQLFCNSLDASCEEIQIEVDFRKGYCSLTDDGVGIPACEFRTGGFLAQAHCTSKSFSTHTHGARGQALASIAASSLLSITSRQKGSSSYTKTRCYTKELSCGLSIPDVTDDHTNSYGTKVIVYNLFGNLPVRFRAQASECSMPGRIGQLFDSLRRRLVAYVLAGAYKVAIELQVSGTSLSYRRVPDAARQTEPVFSSVSIHQILKQARLVPISDTAQWRVASARSGSISIRVAFFANALPSRQCQFLSFGCRPVYNDSSGSWIFDVVNDMFQASNSGLDVGSVEPPSQSCGRESHDGRKRRQDRPMLVHKVDRWPAFFIRVDCTDDVPARASIANQDRTGNDIHAQQVVTLLKLLLKRCFATDCPGTITRTTARAHSEDGKQAEKPKFSPFDTFRRTKSAFPSNDQDMCRGLPFIDDNPTSGFSSPNADVQLLLNDMEVDDNLFSTSDAATPIDVTPDPDLQTSGSIADPANLLWTNPKTGRLVRLNDNSFVVPASNDLIGHESDGSGCDHCRNPRPLATRKPSLDRKGLVERLRQWPTSTFSSRAEVPIDATGANQRERPWQLSNPNAVSTEQPLCATDLATAKVLVQIDRKFILALVSKTNVRGSLLVLVDQHAADERVKVEQLFRLLSSGKSTTLSRPIHVEVDARELERLAHVQNSLSRWGFAYERSKMAENAISVTHVPEIIAERCRQEPKVLIDLLRGEIWSQNPRPTITRCGPMISVIDQMVDCPSGLVDMVNSRACRSAVMFNDVLSVERCGELIKDLSKCALPFQCAHGRPSLTVLANVGEAGFGNISEVRTESFVAAYRNWL